jgi:hypothetical protein
MLNNKDLLKAIKGLLLEIGKLNSQSGKQFTLEGQAGKLVGRRPET